MTILRRSVFRKKELPKPGTGKYRVVSSHQGALETEMAV
jgi:hypothetical protein